MSCVASFNFYLSDLFGFETPAALIIFNIFAGKPPGTFEITLGMIA
jgi:hypothetical protein